MANPIRFVTLTKNGTPWKIALGGSRANVTDAKENIYISDYFGLIGLPGELSESAEPLAYKDGDDYNDLAVRRGKTIQLEILIGDYTRADEDVANEVFENFMDFLKNNGNIYTINTNWSHAGPYTAILVRPEETANGDGSKNYFQFTLHFATREAW